MKKSNYLTGEIIETYLRRTKASKARHESARNFLPGGDTRTTVFFEPYPTCMDRGVGCRLYDVDGNVYLDFLGNYTSLIHGHAHERIIRAACDALEKGSIFGAPSEVQVRHAEHLCKRVSSMDLVRYCNSGTEATMFAMRAARAFTGRDVIVKIEGGYHGTHDVAEVDVRFETNGDRSSPPIAKRGVPACTADGVMVIPFNDLEAAESAMREGKDKLAAVILEPVMGAAGLIPPEPRYLKGMRELADKNGLLLIFDEIITFRLNAGGMQAVEGVRPDLTTLGKIIGGGLPVGAFGGRKEIMEIFDPGHPRRLEHGGTFNGNNVAMAAGLSTLEMLDDHSIQRINALGDRLREGFRRALINAGIRGQITGLGSLIGVHWGETAPKAARGAALMKASAGELPNLLHKAMLNEGIFSAPRGLYAISTPMTEKEIDQAVTGFEASLERIKPYIESHLEHLLAN
jgi:glutamate-1-semialdehyde 2,1-aminomutase